MFNCFCTFSTTPRSLGLFYANTSLWNVWASASIFRLHRNLQAPEFCSFLQLWTTSFCCVLSFFPCWISFATMYPVLTVYTLVAENDHTNLFFHYECRLGYWWYACNLPHWTQHLSYPLSTFHLVLIYLCTFYSWHFGSFKVDIFPFPLFIIRLCFQMLILCPFPILMCLGYILFFLKLCVKLTMTYKMRWRE